MREHADTERLSVKLLLAGSAGTLPDGTDGSGISSDGVHPNETGYRMMAPLTERAITEAQRRR